ncbi:MAG: hypothetical protein N2039_04520, partial [Gemmataceae bacterium]|nr:hypothetical protein [Gemmataceae bacterium]
SVVRSPVIGQRCLTSDGSIQDWLLGQGWPVLVGCWAVIDPWRPPRSVRGQELSSARKGSIE